MKKKIIIGICILLAIVLLIPFPRYLDDGGTVVYDAILYDVYDVHRLNPDTTSAQEFVEGTTAYVLGLKVFDNVK